MIFWAKIILKSIISSKFSRLSRFISKFLKNASILFASTSISTLSTKFYMTMNNLFVMFNKKSKSLDLQHCQKNKSFSYHWQLNKFVIFYQIRITTYFLSSFNWFKFNVLSKAKLCLFIQTNVYCYRRLFKSTCEQMIIFAF